jgi:hypothetical protein
VLFQEDESGCLEWEHPPDRLDDTDVAFAVTGEFLVNATCPIGPSEKLLGKV